MVLLWMPTVLAMFLIIQGLNVSTALVRKSCTINSKDVRTVATDAVGALEELRHSGQDDLRVSTPQRHRTVATDAGDVPKELWHSEQDDMLVRKLQRDSELHAKLPKQLASQRHCDETSGAIGGDESKVRKFATDTASEGLMRKIAFGIPEEPVGSQQDDTKHAAIILHGLAYVPDFHHWAGIDYTIDYRWSVDNYKKYIFDYLHRDGFSTDVFLCTHSSAVDSNILKDYQPVRHLFLNDSSVAHDLAARFRKQREAINLTLSYSRQHHVNYSRVIMTRFDLFFHEDFGASNIQWDKLNIVSQLEVGNAIDDNFYAMPFSKLEAFDSLLEVSGSRTR